MSEPRHRGRWVPAAIVLVCALVAASPLLDAGRGLTIDLLTALRWHALGPRHEPARSPAVVVAIDEPTYATPPFAGSPTITWTREIGRVVSALVEQGQAAVVGFDVVFPASIEQSAIPFGDEPLGARLRGFDRDFLRALRAAAASGRLVLGEVQHGAEPIRPSAGQRVAVGQAQNIRSLNVHSDVDEVVRRVPTSFESADGARVASMSLELAARALGVAPRFDTDGAVALAGWRVPASQPHTMTLAFEGGGDDIPTYSLADLRNCLDAGGTDYLRRHFAGKVVLLGTLLDIEDRKSTSKRWATGIERAGAERCTPGPAQAGPAAMRRTISGVYIHATAVNNLVRREALVEPGRGGVLVAGLVLAALAAAAALRLAPAAALLATGLVVGAAVAGGVAAIQAGVVLPVVEASTAAALALVAALGWRFAVTEREERLLRRSFSLYLSPQLIDRMVDTGRLPALGGEMRVVTAFFSDIVGFSTFSETMTPAELVSVMNEYLSEMTDIIESCGGYVDKYVGDSIVAVFGAPVADADHAGNAVRAALGCRERLARLNADAKAFHGRRIEHRIGINTGEALVGNIGSRRRFNYTVMSDAVNLASRLEGANKYFGTSVLVSETTVAQAGPSFEWREIDAVRVKGRVQPVRVFELQSLAGTADPGRVEQLKAYAEGLAAWRSRDFDQAARAFARHAATDLPAAMFERRARDLASRPPGADWEAVNTLDGK